VAAEPLNAASEAVGHELDELEVTGFKVFLTHSSSSSTKYQHSVAAEPLSAASEAVGHELDEFKYTGFKVCLRSRSASRGC